MGRFNSNRQQKEARSLSHYHHQFDETWLIFVIGPMKGRVYHRHKCDEATFHRQNLEDDCVISVMKTLEI